MVDEVSGVAVEATEATPAPASTEHAEGSVSVENVAPETTTKRDVDADLKAVWEKNNPPRNKSTGRFESVAKPVEEPVAEPAPEEAPVSEDQPQAEEAKPETPAIDAPQSWSNEHKSAWAKIPPAEQQYIIQRENEAHEKISRQGQTIKAYEPIGQVIQQYMTTFQRNNLHPAEGFARLLSVENRLAHDPVPAILDLCQAYGVDPRELGGQQGSTDGQQPAPETAEISRLKQALAETQDQLRQLGSTFTGLQQTQEQQTLADAHATIANFAKDKPHFERVRVEMGRQMQLHPDWDMAKAYEKAILLDDELQTQIKADEAKKAEAKRLEEAKKKAAEAKKSAAANVKSTPGAGATPKSMDDTLREVAIKTYGAF